MKKIVFFVIIFVSLVIIHNLLVSIFTLWQKQDLVIQAQNELKLEREENSTLKKQLEIARSDTFLEEEARNKLFLVKPGESKIVIPDRVLQASTAAKAESLDVTPNWEKWVKFFIGQK